MRRAWSFEPVRRPIVWWGPGRTAPGWCPSTMVGGSLCPQTGEVLLQPPAWTPTRCHESYEECHIGTALSCTLPATHRIL